MAGYIIAVVCAVLGLLADQYTKYVVANNFVMFEQHDFIKGLLNLVYIRNDGAAWGILGGGTLVLVIITAIIMALCIFVLFKYAFKKNALLFWAVSLVLSGGVGNMIDRIFRGGRVVDFLQFDFWQDFPVFNIADCFIVAGAGFFILYFIIDMVNDIKSKKKSVEDNGTN